MKKLSMFLIGIFLIFCTAAASAEQIETIEITADTYVQGGDYKSTNYGQNQTIAAKRESTGGVNGTDRRIYMKVNLTESALEMANTVKLSFTSASAASGYVYAADWTDWEEDSFTMNDEPYHSYAEIESQYTLLGEITTVKGQQTTLDLTDYVKNSMKNQAFTLIFVGDNNPTPSKRTMMQIYSRESGNAPKIEISFDKSCMAKLQSWHSKDGVMKLEYSYVNFSAEKKKPVSIIAGYRRENGVNRLVCVRYTECAMNDPSGTLSIQREVSGTDAEIWKASLWDNMVPICDRSELEKTEKLEVLYPTADAYTIAGDSQNYGTQNTLSIGKKSVLYKTYIMFDLSDLSPGDLSDAYLILHTTASQKSDGGSLYVNAAENSEWTENAITANNAPGINERIASSYMINGMTSSFDLTEYIENQLESGTKKITLVISDNNLSGLTTFASREDEERAPKLVLSYGDSFCYPTVTGDKSYFNQDTDPVENAKKMVAASHAEYGGDISCDPGTDDSGYIESVQAKKLVSDTRYTTYKTRTLESLSGFTATDVVEELCSYGGLKRKTQKATGYFYIAADEDGSHLVDPCGHTMLLLGLDNVASSNVASAAISKYGSTSAWAAETSKYLKNRLLLNSAVNWSQFDLDLLNTEDSPGMMLIIGVLTNYAKRFGLAQQQKGHEGFINNNCMPVFDPYFDTFANNYIHGNINAYRNRKNIIGFFSDNELPNDSNMLLQYLMLDPSDPYNAYSHAAAWEWLAQRTGKQRPALSDVTKNLNDDFYDFVYDRYYQVVEPKYRKYAPNHLYFGERMMSYANSTHPGIIRATGRYADAMAMNYYGVWTPSTNVMNKWLEWSKNPFLISEWYAKGEDSKYQTSADTGAGFICKTQSDRGKFYQHYAIKLIENPNCIGYVWFGYADTQTTNRGVLSLELEEYEELAKRMARLNRNIYRVMEFLRQ